MKTFLPLSLFLCALCAEAALPTSPLTTEYILTGDESLTDSSYKISSGGVLQIGDDTNGSGSLTLNYTSGISTNPLIMDGNGSIVIGTENTSGTLEIKGTTASIAKGPITMTSTNTITVNKSGTLMVSGEALNQWWNFTTITNLNVKGYVSIQPTTSDFHSYFEVKNLNLYDTATLTSIPGAMRMYVGGTWNIYGQGLTTNNIKVGNTGGTCTLNLLAENALDGVKQIDIDTTYGVTFNINLSDNTNTIKTLGINSNSIVNIKFAQTKTVDTYFLIETLTGKDNGADKTNVKMNIENFENFYFLVSDTYGLQISEDNRLFIKDKNTYIDLTAYTGDNTGTALDGKWSLVADGTGLFWLNNSAAVPEPATVAAILGALALGLAAYRKRK